MDTLYPDGISQDNTETVLSDSVSAESPTVVVNQPEQVKKPSRPRNYSFKRKIEKSIADPDKSSLNTVEVDGVVVHIPASVGSTYWAIQKVCYENANKPVYADHLCREVEKLMIDRDKEQWEKYTGKTHTTVFKKSEGKRSTKPTASWQERIIGNAKTLTRLGGSSRYGYRLYEQGHLLRAYVDKTT